MLIVGGSVFAVATRRVNRVHDLPPPPITRAIAPEEIARGGRLFRTNCLDCHAGAPAPGQRGERRPSGARVTGAPSFLGELWAPNLTADPQTGIGAWTDAELARLLRNGLRRDGRYAATMPRFARLADADVAALIGFLRSDAPLVAPVRNDVPRPGLGRRRNSGAGLRGRGRYRGSGARADATPRSVRRIRALSGRGRLRVRRLSHRGIHTHRGEAALPAAAGGRPVSPQPPRRTYLLVQPDVRPRDRHQGAECGGGPGPSPDDRDAPRWPGCAAPHANLPQPGCRRGRGPVRLPARAAAGLSAHAWTTPGAAGVDGLTGPPVHHPGLFDLLTAKGPRTTRC